ncbi:hypothetical protein ACSHT0_06470 [Tepidicaulis sp. LMO-SS28]|uniref:hypothetical protein n=1 Tax=Tepidicaulis sp. LMO-SS28 TaxID=3447455 RepID=UPI003EDF406D
MTFERAVSLLFWPVLAVDGLIWGVVLTDILALDWPAILDTAERYDGVLGAAMTALGLVVAWMLGKKQAEAPLVAERQRALGAARVATGRFLRELDAFETRVRSSVSLIEKVLIWNDDQFRSWIDGHPQVTTTKGEVRTFLLRHIHKDFLCALPSFGRAEREYLAPLETADPGLFFKARSVIDAFGNFEETRDAYQMWEADYMPHNGLIWVPPALIWLCDFIAFSAEFRGMSARAFPETDFYSWDQYEKDAVQVATRVRSWAREVQVEMQTAHQQKVAAKSSGDD